MKNLGNLVKQAQRMKAEMEKIQEEAAAKKVEGTAGGGMVTVVCNGRGEVVAGKIDPGGGGVGSGHHRDEGADPGLCGMLQRLGGRAMSYLRRPDSRRIGAVRGGR